MNEHQEQVAVVEWFRLQYPKHILFAIPNGGARHIVTAVNLKREGVISGVPDLFVMYPAFPFHGLFIEMKAKGGKVSPAQKEFMAAAIDNGYQASVCYGFDEAREAINLYLHCENSSV